jgi:Domain of unknown function (DUF5668)
MTTEHHHDKAVCVSEKCPCTHHQIIPLLIIVLGLLFLLANLQLVNYEIVTVLWPILLIVIGMVKIGDHKCKCC